MSKSFLSPPEITSAIISMGVARGNEKNIIKTCWHSRHGRV